MVSEATTTLTKTKGENGMGAESSIRTFRDLVVWQKAFQLCLDVYKLTRAFPADERYGMTSELRRTSRSIPYNIAEGHKRRTTAEYIHFLGIASGSGGELETQILLARSLEYLLEQDAGRLLDLYAEVERMLQALMKSLERKQRGKAKGGTP